MKWDKQRKLRIDCQRINPLKAFINPCPTFFWLEAKVIWLRSALRRFVLRIGPQGDIF